MSPEDQANFDQNAAAFADNFPLLWRRLFKGCIKAEFTETESLKLLQTYILSQSPSGIRGLNE